MLGYQATLDYLYSLTDYEKERPVRYDPDTFDLSRVRRVLARLGEPHRRFPTLHIAGTKGKGSVAAMCASVLQAAGLRSGLYTSPHLHSFRERIQVDGEMIPADVLVTLVQEYRPIFDEEPELTTFEVITVLAFAYLAQRQVDCAVIEVGLGGRLDATNVITPQVAVITSLSLDHTYWLGDTLADVAREKAGIVKPGVPTICEPQQASALAVIQQICAERESPLTLVGRDWVWQRQAFSLDNQSFDLRRTPEASSLDGAYTIPLLGRYQVTNAVTAIAALDLLRLPAGLAARCGGMRVRPHHVRRGLAEVRWPGRFEILRREPSVVVDCAHNSDSLARLVAALEEWFGPNQNWTFILGVSNDKDVPGMLRALAPRAGCLLTTQSRHARAMPSARVMELASEVLPLVEQTDDVGAALLLALGRESGPICITGSIFVVAEAREAWALYTGHALPETDRLISKLLADPSTVPV